MRWGQDKSLPQIAIQRDLAKHSDKQERTMRVRDEKEARWIKKFFLHQSRIQGNNRYVRIWCARARNCPKDM